MTKGMEIWKRLYDVAAAAAAHHRGTDDQRIMTTAAVAKAIKGLDKDEVDALCRTHEFKKGRRAANRHNVIAEQLVDESALSLFL